MLENHDFIVNGDVRLYVRHIRPVPGSDTGPVPRAIILMNSRSLCVESSMGIPMGSVSYGDYMAQHGTHCFLVDLRGFGMSTPIQEQTASSAEDVTNPMTVKKYYSDIRAAADHVRRVLGQDCEVNVMGFSFLGTIVIAFSHLHPDVFKNVIALNPPWPSDPEKDPPRGFDFMISNDELPYIEVSLEKIDQRLAQAQPPGQDYREPLWFEEAADRLARYHRTFDHATGRWRSHRNLPWRKHLFSLEDMSNIKANLLVITAEHDIENPFWSVERLYNRINITNKQIKVLPMATHLCIWERSRMQLYQWTQEFICYQ